MKVQIIQVPYDSAQRGKRMGSGPEYFLVHGLEQRFADDGHEVESESIEARAAFPPEIKTSFGTIGSTSGKALGVIWFDAHGDFNTPETTESGFLDGMVLAAAAGLCWKAEGVSFVSIAASLPRDQVFDLPTSADDVFH